MFRRQYRFYTIVSIGTQQHRQTSDNQYIQPNEGNVYYRMEFEFENISDHDQLASSWDFECYADDYSQCGEKRASLVGKDCPRCYLEEV